MDDIVNITSYDMVNFPEENITIGITAETNVSSTSLESQFDGNISGNIAVNENTRVMPIEIMDPSSILGHSDMINTLTVSQKNETLIDVNSTESVSIVIESTGDNTTQTSTEIKSTEKFSSQIPSDSPTPTLSSVTNSSLVAKELVTEAERVNNSTTESSNIEINETILMTAQPSDTGGVETTVPSNNLETTTAEENGAALDVTMNTVTTTNSAAVDLSASPFIQPSADAGHVQDLRMLSNSTDGFDLIMDSTIDSVDIGTVRIETNSTGTTEVTNNIGTVSESLDPPSVDAMSFNSGTSEPVQSSTESSVTPVSSSTGSFEGNSPGITETVTFETARGTTLSTGVPSISADAENNNVGSLLSTGTESVSVTTTSMDKLINPQIQTTDQVTLPAVTVTTTMSNSLQATSKPTFPSTYYTTVITNQPTVLITESTPVINKPTVSITDSSSITDSTSVIPDKPTIPITDSTLVITNKSTAPITDSAPVINKPTVPITDSAPIVTTDSVLPPILIKSVSAETDDQTSTQYQIESTSNSNKDTMVNVEVTSEVTGTKSNLEATTETSQQLKSTSNGPLESTTESSASSLLSTTLKGALSIDSENNSIVSRPEAASLIVESTANAGETRKTTEKNTVVMSVELPGIDTETTQPVTATSKMTTAQSTTDNKVEITGAMTSRLTTKVETTVPMINDPITTTTTTATTTTQAPSTTTVSTTPRPCPVYQSKYNRNDLIVSTDPEGCVMIAKIVDLRGRFRGPNRMIWRKMHAGLRGLRYPSVSFTYNGSEDTEDKCQMPVKSVGPYIVVDTILGRCQMVVGLRSVRAPVNTPGKKGQQQRRFRFRLVMRPVLEYLETNLL
ncbi:mucin-2-like [Saccostrea cucullata]|uniref:mucin-2-like n=1 Tax=Saccostrea cuccullata TaxID=36930 RepID=UPI002ED1BDF9